MQTAYHYLDLGGRKIKEMDNVMLEQYAGKKVEGSPEEEEIEEDGPVEQPILESKPSPKPEKSIRERLAELEQRYERGELE